ncbi:TonB-dependent receptor [Temperatibacter marinus]|uniref:TonB-dependent receptor n=1 Tax=Temperatibacter marinus TaxID=1456591 RepID=A0AA52HAJ9_9PROT|nr:TonB-dependent receptor [Temperatibacter marinus]WND02678.1 TonB-dependent receptor [Temperatibacter marinus]
MKKSTKYLMSASLGAMLISQPQMVMAQDSDEAAAAEEIAVIGSRSKKPRTATDSPVPIDVFGANQINEMGNAADMTDNLKALVPSFTASPATGDGSAFVRPTSLRGLAPDQTLVLLGGKRRHRSALLHFFAPAAGNGAHGPDIGMIPGIALKRVEVLRDGAAAQYGADAIAGVINFVPRDNSEGGLVTASYGQFYEGESSIKIAGNVGFPLGDNGFINLSMEYVDNDALSRGTQRPDAQALEDAGVPGVGSDSPFGDAPLVQTWGRPETSGFMTFLNSGLELNEDHSLYFMGNYSEKEGRYRFFYRSPTHSSLAPLRADGFTGLPAGFTPYLDGDQTDFSAIGGIKGVFGDVDYDFSMAYGYSEMDYFLNNSVNPSLGLSGGQIAQMDFDVGALFQEEMNINLDFSKELNDTLNLAWGAEYRDETYQIASGEPGSFIGAGVSGFKGYHPRDSGEFSRDNWAVYADLEQDVNEDFLMQYALRYENFSDFGSTVNGKIAARYNANETWTLRAAVSTGFHAPTPGQSNVQAVITTFDSISGGLVEEGLVRPDSAAALGAGGAPLTEEKSKNFSFGATGVYENTTLTIDFYRIEIDDRIYRTINLPGAAPGQTVSFFTNSLDMYSQGIDVVLNSSVDWNDDVTTDLTWAANFNKIKITGQKDVNGQQPVSNSTIEDIENNYPSTRMVFTTNTKWGEDKWNLMVRANYYGKHYDERGEIGAATNPSFEIGSTIYVDAELGYQVNEGLKVVLGASNIFDSYVDVIDAPYANRQSVGLPYPRRSAANYEGGSWYLRASFAF